MTDRQAIVKKKHKKTKRKSTRTRTAHMIWVRTWHTVQHRTVLITLIDLAATTKRDQLHVVSAHIDFHSLTCVFVCVWFENILKRLKCKHHISWCWSLGSQTVGDLAFYYLLPVLQWKCKSIPHNSVIQNILWVYWQVYDLSHHRADCLETGITSY